MINHNGKLCVLDIYTQQIILPHVVKKKKRFRLKLYKKTDFKKRNKEKYKFLAVVLFFLLCGLVYSHSVQKGTLHLGTQIAAEDFGKPMGEVAETLQKINLNTATKEDFLQLSGIGEKRAEDIIAYRDEIGAFHHIEEIQNVSGIGEKIYNEIKEQIMIEE